MSAPSREEMSRRLRKILARRRRKLEGPWPARLWRWLRAKLARPEEDRSARWSAPPMGGPVTLAAKRAAARVDHIRAMNAGEPDPYAHARCLLCRQLPFEPFADPRLCDDGKRHQVREAGFTGGAQSTWDGPSGRL